jgi:flagellar basal-body rod modification protein FlgD
MQIDNATPSGGTSPASVTAKSTPTIGYDAFLELLIAQLRNQDPTNPVDSAQYVSQLAALSELEQSVKQTTAIDRISAKFDISIASSIVGKRVATEDSALNGIVVAADIEVDRIIAKLDNGTEIPLGPGIRIEEA